MNKFNIGDIVCGTDRMNKEWNATFTAEVMSRISYTEIRIRFLSWESESPNNQWQDRDENQLFYYPESFFQLVKPRSYAENLFLGD